MGTHAFEDVILGPDLIAAEACLRQQHCRGTASMLMSAFGCVISGPDTTAAKLWLAHLEEIHHGEGTAGMLAACV